MKFWNTKFCKKELGTFLSTGLPKPLEGKGRNIRLVGDCKQVGNVKTVIWGAYEAAMKI